MVNKSLNAALDAQFDMVNSDVVAKKPVKEKKVKVKKVKKNKPCRIMLYLISVKNYLFPAIHFEATDISDFGTTVVNSVDRGIKNHFKIIKDWFVSVFSKKVDSEKIIEEPEDIDVSAVKNVIRNNKLKK